MRKKLSLKNEVKLFLEKNGNVTKMLNLMNGFNSRYICSFYSRGHISEMHLYYFQR